MSDRNILSTPETAMLLGEDVAKTRLRLAKDAAFRTAVALDEPEGFHRKISLPRLGRYVHGAEFEMIRDEWYERLADYRKERVSA